jgi:hypothetical protein
MFVYMLSIINIRHKSESLYERILYFNNNIYCALKSFKRNMSLLSITTPKSLNYPYAGYLFVFQICFCAWETEEESQIDV